MNKTEKLKHIILSKYNSIREFSNIVGIPSTTLTSALDKGIGGMAVDRIIKICDVLNIDIKTFEPIDTISQVLTLSKLENRLLENYNNSTDEGKNMILSYSDYISQNYNKNNYDNEISATLNVAEEPATYGSKPEITFDDFNTIAAHNDDLTDDEITEVNRRILEDLNRRNK